MRGPDTVAFMGWYDLSVGRYWHLESGLVVAPCLGIRHTAPAARPTRAWNLNVDPVGLPDGPLGRPDGPLDGHDDV